ncbi:MAG: Ppx/GppA family phosphatase, partial [Mangrovicoccus sp.]
MDEDSWAMFGRPIFDDPAAKSLARVGVVDVGSNSVRLVIFDGAARSPAYFFNEKVLCGLGAGMAETGHLNPDGRQRALAALRRFQAIAKGMGIAPLMAVATAAVREAKDGPAFREEIERETGLRLEVIDGREEARLSAQGVLLGWPEADGLVCDIGGSSMELALVQNGEIGWRETSPLGPLELAKLQGDEGTLNDWITSHLRAMREDLPNPPKRMYLVGGSWRAVARLDMVRRSYPLKVLHEYRISPEGLAETLDLVERSDPTELRKRAGVSGDRMALIPLASRVLAGLSKVLAPEEFYISSYGLREGLLYESMPKDLRARDPLIEACLHAEARNARVPGFGRILYEFLRPLYRDSSPEELRIIKAACLLHDVSWRTHP